MAIVVLSLLMAANVEAKKKVTNKIPADLTGAARECYNAAVKGDPGAQLELGHYYQEGEGAPKDLAKAFYWYKKAADKGHPIAQFNVAEMYDTGEGVARDMVRRLNGTARLPTKATTWLSATWEAATSTAMEWEWITTKAAYWYRKAAMQGNAIGQRCLGICYEEGKGVSQDHAIANEWYEKAAIQGDAVAQFNLGLSYAEGEGVKKDKKKAKEWLQKAAEQGVEEAKIALKEL